VIVLFEEFLFHLIVTNKLFLICNLLVGLVLAHHLSTEVSFAHIALLNHEIHLLLDLLLDSSLKSFQKLSTGSLFLQFVLFLNALVVV